MTLISDKNKKRFLTFSDRYPLVGPTFWIISVQYFFVQYLVSTKFKGGYNWSKNTISDLGNSVCALYNGRQVCSPLHDVMNISFIVLGITIMIGAVLVYEEFRQNRYSSIGFLFMGLAGFGSIFVGLFPENAPGMYHELGALLPFILGNISLTLLGAFLKEPFGFKLYTILSGLVGIIGVCFYFAHTYIGLGQGGLERVVAYPQTIWLIAFGIYISKNRYTTYISKKARQLT
jgi:hypothetical membrane protein